MDDFGRAAFSGRSVARAQARVRERNGVGRALIAVGMALSLAAIAVFSIGCEGGSDGGATSAPAYLPDWDEARGALEWVLNTWRGVEGPLPATLGSDTVKLIDTQRRPDQRLKSYAVLGRVELPNARQFTVRLELEAEPGPVLVRYNVLGRFPIWVFRLEDFEMIAHWEHPMGDDANALPSTGGQLPNAPDAKNGPSTAGPSEAAEPGTGPERPGPAERPARAR